MQTGDFNAIASKADEFDHFPVYRDDTYEYGNVVLPPHTVAKHLPVWIILTESEWRQAGVVMSRGWQHYDWHKPENHILLFRRPIRTDPKKKFTPPQARKNAERREEAERKLEETRRCGLDERARDEG